MFIPDYIYDTVYDIPLDVFLSRGISHLFLDIDNTLVSYSTPSPTDDNISWFNTLKENGINVVFVSNNSEERVSQYAKGLGFEYISNSHKPLPGAYNKLICKLAIDKKCIASVGDQIFTDVLAARLTGLGLSILVKPVEKKENAFFKFKRACEVPFINYYYHKK